MAIDFSALEAFARERIPALLEEGCDTDELVQKLLERFLGDAAPSAEELEQITDFLKKLVLGFKGKQTAERLGSFLSGMKD